jgi:RNA polymerase sigma factor (TIGR02999 family)
MSGVTRRLDAAASGDRKAAADLFPRVDDGLQTLAAVRMAAETPGHTLNPTVLFHVVYLRLVGGRRFDGRGRVFAAVGTMRRILADSTRRKRTRMDGGDDRQVDLRDIPADVRMADERLLDLDAALTRSAAEDSVAARVVELRHFAGLSIEAAAAALGLSGATADRGLTRVTG